MRKMLKKLDVVIPSVVLTLLMALLDLEGLAFPLLHLPM